MKKNELEKHLQSVLISVVKRKAKFFLSCQVGHTPIETPNYLLADSSSCIYTKVISP